MFVALLISILCSTCHSAFRKTNRLREREDWTSFDNNDEMTGAEIAVVAASGALPLVQVIAGGALKAAIGLAAGCGVLVASQGIIMATIMQQANSYVPTKTILDIKNPPSHGAVDAVLSHGGPKGGSLTVPTNHIITIAPIGPIGRKEFFYGYLSAYSWTDPQDGDKPRWWSLNAGLGIGTPTLKRVSLEDVLASIGKKNRVKVTDANTKYDLNLCTRPDSARSGDFSQYYYDQDDEEQEFVRGFKAGIKAARKRNSRLFEFM